MASARNSTVAQWAQQIYGPTSKPPNHGAGLRSDIEFLVALKSLNKISTSTPVLPPKQFTNATGSSHSSTASTPSQEAHSAASTQETSQKTTPEPVPTSKRNPSEFAISTEKIPLESATTIRRLPLKHRDATAQQKATKKAEPEGPSLEVDWRIWYPDPIAVDKYVRSLSEVDQLEYFVRIKIKTFREKLRVSVPLYTKQWRKDKEEDAYRRKFFEKHGAEAFKDQYIYSNYFGPNGALCLERKEGGEWEGSFHRPLHAPVF
ncbi:hypothetical protein diail_630 [Diaporthe ilicicola]|nr:hypothetical protein diail_630 [Diaporthe ilicicola]